MGSLNNLIKALSDSDKIIKPRYDVWLPKHGDEPYSPEIAAWVAEQLQKQPRDRSGSFSASAGGTCPRAQELQYLGRPPTVATNDAQLERIFKNGKWGHLRYQADLLQAGIIDDAEVPLVIDRRNVIGSADGTGIVWDGHSKSHWRGLRFGFELKTMNTWQFGSIKKAQEKSLMIQAKREHMFQTHRYFIASGWDLFVILYEDKTTQETQEWVIEPDPVIMQEAEDELKLINRAIGKKQLTPMLPNCVKARGTEWNQCQYGQKGGTCVKAGDWPRLRKPRRRITP